MKRLLILALATWCGCHAHAQGTFIFSNHVIAAGVAAPIFDINGTSMLDGANFVAAVFLNGVQLGATAPFRTGASAGCWDAGGDGVRVVPGHFSGEIVSGFTVEVWDSLRGVDAHSVCLAEGKFGFSAHFSIKLGGPKTDPSLPPDLPGVMSSFQSFQISPFSCVPEPSVLAFGLLGAALLASGWRRK